MTYRTGTIGEFMKWTKRVISDPAAAQETPGRWFDSDETAAKALGASATPEVRGSSLPDRSHGVSSP
jgi:hypothetical protein